MRAPFLKTMSRQASGTSAATPVRAVIDISDGLHVLDFRQNIGDPVAGGLGSPGAVDLEDEQVFLLLAGVFDFSRQERDRDVVEQPSSLIQSGRTLWPRVGSSTD